MHIKGVINDLNSLKSENAGLMWADTKNSLVFENWMVQKFFDVEKCYVLHWW